MPELHVHSVHTGCPSCIYTLCIPCVRVAPTLRAYRVSELHLHSVRTGCPSCTYTVCIPGVRVVPTLCAYRVSELHLHSVHTGCPSYTYTLCVLGVRVAPFHTAVRFPATFELSQHAMTTFTTQCYTTCDVSCNQEDGGASVSIVARLRDVRLMNE